MVNVKCVNVITSTIIILKNIARRRFVVYFFNGWSDFAITALVRSTHIKTIAWCRWTKKAFGSIAVSRRNIFTTYTKLYPLSVRNFTSSNNWEVSYLSLSCKNIVPSLCVCKNSFFNFAFCFLLSNLLVGINIIYVVWRHLM